MFEVFAAESASKVGGIMSSASGFVPIIFAGVVFYFLLWRPEQKKAKLKREMLSNLDIGDEVIMQCGIHGSIHSAKKDSDTVELKIAHNTTIQINKSSIEKKVQHENQN